MRLRQRSMLTGVAVLLTATLLSFGPADSSPTAYAQTQGESTTTTPQGITVVGEGSSAVEPDIAVANIGVQVANADVRAASDEAEESMNAVIAAIQEQNVAEEDIQTSGFSIFAEFSPAPAASEQPQTPLYRVSNNVNVTIRVLDQVATILDAAIGAGANNIFGVNFSSQATQRRVRQRATASATPTPPPDQPTVAQLLSVDEEYRRRAEADELNKIAPRRFNPNREAWLPVLHTEREEWEFTAVFSNTARAHELNATRDWVVIYYRPEGKGQDAEGQNTVVTETGGILVGIRVIRGREEECRHYYTEAAPTHQHDDGVAAQIKDEEAIPF